MPQKDNFTGKYEVLADFTDSEDGMTIYRAHKDKYPRSGYAPTDARVAYLQSRDNALGKPVIAKN